VKKVHFPTMPEAEQRSPSGKFHSFCKNISVALGARRRVDEPGEAHPFDLQFRRIPPGASVCPYHAHSAQWELFVIVQGRATVRRDGQTHVLPAGRALLHPPGATHQIINDSTTEDLIVTIIADNPLVEFYRYPDSDKFGTRPLGKYFRITEVDYFDGEEIEPTPPLARVTSPITGFRAPQPLAQVSIDALPWHEARSPKGKFHSYYKDISVALGASRNATPLDGGHPFDLQVRRVPPGAAVCPRHVHTLQWELFVILAGQAIVHADTEQHTVATGDCFLQRPGIAHQLINPGPDDLTFYVIADNHAADSTYYPDSQKWQMKPQGKIFRAIEADYFDREE
jgi:uncharacterized cupin superfamily protein